MLDSREGAIPEGFIAMEAARTAAEGLPPEEVLQRALALQRLQPVEILYAGFTPVMGVHTGPGLVGVACYYEP